MRQAAGAASAVNGIKKRFSDGITGSTAADPQRPSRKSRVAQAQNRPIILQHALTARAAAGSEYSRTGHVHSSA